MSNSIKGFRFNGNTYKYDYTALDNAPNVETDKTLAITNRPADAKAVGDEIASIRNAVGTPLTAETASGMTDTNKIYVYTGSETGYTNGNWYYFDTAQNIWVSGGAYNSAAIDTDDTLTYAGKAADAKAVGDEITGLKSALNALEDELSTSESIDFTSNTYSTFINSSNKWSTGSRTCSILPIPTGAKTVMITANQNLESMVAFLTTDSHVSGNTPDYANGTALMTVPLNDNERFTIPEDANYLYVAKTFGGSEYTPQNAQWFFYKDIPEIDDSLTLSDYAADAKTTGDELDKINNKIDSAFFDKVEIDLTSAGYKAFIGDSGKWSTSGYSFIEKIENNDKLVEIIANDTMASYIAFLKTDSHGSNTSPNYSDGTGRIEIQPGEKRQFILPEDANYLYVMKSYSTSNYTPEKVQLLRIKNQDVTVCPIGLHEMPENDGVLNVIKRCRQMTDIKWTPSVDLPRLMLVQRSAPFYEGGPGGQKNYQGVFKAGVEYVGIPYGRCDEQMSEYDYRYSYVGSYISFDTFISSVMNSKSKLSLESAYDVSNHESVIYAAVCSALVCYALSVPYHATSTIPNINGLNLIGKINDGGTLLSESEFKLGDCLCMPGTHTAIITDIIRDTNNAIKTIELSEATTEGLADKNYADGLIGGVCRRKGWTIEQIYSNWGDYNLYRYSLIANVQYVPSPYVNVGDELDMWRIEHFPVMPYEGNNFIFKSGNIPNNSVKLVITIEDYSYLRVFKDGVEINGSPFSITSSTESFNIDTVDVGEYSAYLCNMQNGEVSTNTATCYWKIIATT